MSKEPLRVGLCTFPFTDHAPIGGLAIFRGGEPVAGIYIESEEEGPVLTILKGKVLNKQLTEIAFSILCNFAAYMTAAKVRADAELQKEHDVRVDKIAEAESEIAELEKEAKDD